MKFNKLKSHTALLILLIHFSIPIVFAETILNGSGATFPYPIYSKWFDEYHNMNPDIQINYQSIGSGGGIRQFTAKTVHFGATDAPMTDKQLSSVAEKSFHLPTVLGAVVPTYNIPGVTELKFTGALLADIYLGKIKNWNDPAIKSLNPSIELPNHPITVIRRSDGSGTTYCWTDYLSKVSADWKSRVGTGISVNWPTGLGAKGNEGVAGMIKQIKNSIGYLELVYAKENNLSFGSVQNASGSYIKASIESISAAAAGVKVPDDFRVSITNSPGDKAYPISTYTWLLIYQKNQGNTGEILKTFLNWALSDGQKYAEPLWFAPLPANVIKMVKDRASLIE